MIYNSILDGSWLFLAVGQSLYFFSGGPVHKYMLNHTNLQSGNIYLNIFTFAGMALSYFRATVI